METDNDRKYSVCDISDALNEMDVDKLNGYKQPTDIDSVESEQESARAEHESVKTGSYERAEIGKYVPRPDKAMDDKSISSILSDVDSLTEERSLDKSDSVQLIMHPTEKLTKSPQNNPHESIELKDMAADSKLASTYISQENTEEEETKISLEQLLDHIEIPPGYHTADGNFMCDTISDSVSDNYDENVPEQTDEKFISNIEPIKCIPAYLKFKVGTGEYPTTKEHDIVSEATKKEVKIDSPNNAKKPLKNGKINGIVLRKHVV